MLLTTSRSRWLLTGVCALKALSRIGPVLEAVKWARLQSDGLGLIRCGDTENWDCAKIGMRETALSRNRAERNQEHGAAAKGVNPRGLDLSGVGARKCGPVIRASVAE